MQENFDGLFPDVRESGETPLRQTQLVMLRLLKILHYLCEKHGVQYFLIAGSAIGAVRHGGFIPWDDDLDVGMTRENYNLFKEKCVPGLPHDIFFQDPYTDAFYPHLDYVDGKLRDKYSSYIHTDGQQLKHHDGLQLDIFVYDRAFLPSKILTVLENIIVNRIAKTAEKRVSILKAISKFSIFGLVYANNWPHKLGILKLNLGKTHLREDEIHKVQLIPFEDTSVYILTKYDAFLTRIYGDYMQLPPLEKRQSNHDVSVAPFEPCDHKEILHWKDRIQVK